MKCFHVLAIVIFLFSISGFTQEKEPNEKWVDAFIWSQTGDNLAASEQWPLALGSYMEAHIQVEKIAENHPSYEPEIVAYRLERLEESMAKMEDKLTAGDHDITMKFVDFIESFEQGQEQRFDNEFKAAYETLLFARRLLDEIIAENPNDFQSAVSTQAEILDESISFLDSQINFRRSTRPSTTLPDGIDWGTTRYVKESDLPKSDEEIGIGSFLFPGVEMDVEPEEENNAEKEESAPNSPGPVRIRMNSKKESDE